MTPMTVLILLAGACGSSQGTHPDDMSAADHRLAAASEEQEATSHDEEYDQGATRVRPRGAGGAGLLFPDDVYNPTDHHYRTAERHRALADEHRGAAATLEGFEQDECGSFPTSTRSACPLIGQLASVEDVDGGVRITFREGTNVEAAQAHVRCHVAFARAEGRDGMSHCPMYVDGARAEPGDGGALLLLSADGDEAVEELRRRTRSHLEE